MWLSKSLTKMPSFTDVISYERCESPNFFGQINIYVNITLVSTSKNLLSSCSHIQFMLMTPKSYKEWRGSINGYEYKTNTDTRNELKKATASQFQLVWKINHEICNMPQWLPSNIKLDINLTFTPSNFILRKELPTLPDVTVSLIWTIIHVRK